MGSFGETEENVCANIRRLRREKEVSISDLALDTGISARTLSSIEGGFRSPTAAEAYHIALTLEVELEELFAAGV